MSVKKINFNDNNVDYICLSTDVKPVNAEPNSVLYEADSGTYYITDGSSWYEFVTNHFKLTGSIAEINNFVRDGVLATDTPPVYIWYPIVNATGANGKSVAAGATVSVAINAPFKAKTAVIYLKPSGTYNCTATLYGAPVPNSTDYMAIGNTGSVAVNTRTALTIHGETRFQLSVKNDDATNALSFDTWVIFEL